MPILTVWSALYYLTEIGLVWRDQDFVARNIVKIVKGEPFNGYVSLKIGGKNRRFNQHNGQTLLPALYGGIARKIASTIAGEITIVPIPNSEAVVGDGSDFRTFEHARGIAKATGSRATAIDLLRWRQAKNKAHQGGGRNPRSHFEDLRVTGKATGQIVLFDDVMTTGSQMIGAYRRLAKDAAAPTCAFVIGRTTHDQVDNMIGWRPEELEITEQPPSLDGILGPGFFDLR
jgi:hypothetical protein